MDHALVIQRLERPSRVEEYYRDVEAAKEEVAKRYPWFMLARESSKELCARVEGDPRSQQATVNILETCRGKLSVKRESCAI